MTFLEGGGGQVSMLDCGGNFPPVEASEVPGLREIKSQWKKEGEREGERDGEMERWWYFVEVTVQLLISFLTKLKK